MHTPHPFGISAETESSAEEFLGATHRDFILEFIEKQQQTEQAVISQFLESQVHDYLRPT